MNIALKKVEIIEWLVQLQDEALLEKVENIKTQSIKASYEANLKPMTSKAYKNILEEAQEEYKRGKVTGQDALEKESEKSRSEVEDLAKKEIEHNRNLAASEAQIRTAEKIKEQILKIDICPLCQNKMTQQHIEHVTLDSLNKIGSSKEIIEKETQSIKEVKQRHQDLTKKLLELSQSISKLKHESSNHKIANEKQRYLKSILVEIDVIKKEIINLSSKKESLENKSIDVTTITEQYNSKLREVEEVSGRTTENLDQTLKL